MIDDFVTQYRQAREIVSKSKRTILHKKTIFLFFFFFFFLHNERGEEELKLNS
jgi:hypothetical protein